MDTTIERLEEGDFVGFEVGRRGGFRVEGGEFNQVR